MRHLASALSISIALALTGCATSAQGPQTSGRDALTSSISADSLRGHLSFLSSDLLEGRGTPSRGVDLAAEYIAAQFRRAGLEAAGDDGYFQTANWQYAKRSPQDIALTVTAGGKTMTLDGTGASANFVDPVTLAHTPAVFMTWQAALDDPDKANGKVLVVPAAAIPGAGAALHRASFWLHAGAGQSPP